MPAFLNTNLPEYSEAYADGLDAARVGSSSTSILRFDAAQLLARGEAIDVADSATDGSSFTINEAGVYLITLGVAVPAGGELRVGIGNFGIVLPYTGDPTIGGDFPDSLLAAQHVIAPASTQIPCTLTTLYRVPQSLLDGGQRGIYALASDAAGAAPAAGDIVSAEAFIHIAKIANVADPSDAPFS